MPLRSLCSRAQQVPAEVQVPRAECNAMGACQCFSIMVFSIVRIEGIEGTAKPLIGLLTLLGLPRLVCLPGLVGL